MSATAPPPDRARTRLAPEDRRRQILGCARRLFGEQAYWAVSLTDVAREAGVARGLVNHYFGGKRGLYLEVLREMIAVPDWAVERLPKGTLEQRVAGMVERFLTVAERHRGIWLVAVSALAQGQDREVEAVMLHAQDQAVDQVLQALALSDPTEAQRAELRAYAWMSRAATDEWLGRGVLTRAQTARLLQTTLLAIVSTPAVRSDPTIGATSTNC